MLRRLLAVLLVISSPALATAADDPALGLGTSGFVDSGGVKIHYVTAGEGPLVVLIHGFPDFWYSWRAQMPALAKNHKVVAIDQRGYNLSGQPEGVESYSIDKLVGDVAAVVRHFDRTDKPKATIVGHDWGGMVAWSFAMARPEMTERLIVLNLPHPRGLTRELANNPAQRLASQYARDFQKPDAASRIKPASLAFWVKDESARKRYEEAFQRSSVESMLNYYKANYPKPPYDKNPALDRDWPRVKCNVLLIHGLNDIALLPGALNDTWQWIDGELTLVTIPGSSHFVQQDAAERVTKLMVDWLAR